MLKAILLLFKSKFVSFIVDSGNVSRGRGCRGHGRAPWRRGSSPNGPAASAAASNAPAAAPSTAGLHLIWWRVAVVS